MQRDTDPGPHLGDAELARFVDGTLPEEARACLEAHLASCAECRAELHSVVRIVRTRSSVRRRSLLPIATALAAGLALVLVSRSRPIEVTPDAPSRRVRQLPESASSIEIVAPADESHLRSVESVTFTWRRLGEEAAYRLTLSDEAGRPIWSTATSDTTVVLPLEIALANGASYFWYVDALGVDGRSSTSGVRRFTVP
jgi:hypothetical protein